MNKMTVKDNSKYLAVSLEKLRSLETIPCDLYISLSQEKFKKIVHRNSKPESLELEVIKKNKITELYVRTSEYFEVEKKIFSDEEKAESVEQDFSLQDEREKLTEILVELGYPKSDVNKSFNYIDNLIHEEKSQSIKKFLTKIDKNIGSFLFNHSFLTAVTGISFLKLQSWTNREIERKYIKAAMMHDAGYSKAEYAWYESSLGKLDQEEIIDEVKYELQNHHLLILEKLNKIGENDDDVVKIIKCHNLTKEQINKTSPNNFTRLASVFYLSHKLTIELYRQAFSIKKRPQAIENVAVILKGSQYEKISNEFCEVMKKIIL